MGTRRKISRRAQPRAASGGSCQGNDPAAGTPLAADVLLVPHHGSRTSSTRGFIDAVAPRWAIVQAGYRNRFGHPAPDVVARYAARGASLVASPGCGAARWSSAAPDRMACERRVAPHYWQHVPPSASLP